MWKESLSLSLCAIDFASSILVLHSEPALFNTGVQVQEPLIQGRRPGAAPKSLESTWQKRVQSTKITSSLIFTSTSLIPTKILKDTCFPSFLTSPCVPNPSRHLNMARLAKPWQGSNQLWQVAAKITRLHINTVCCICKCHSESQTTKDCSRKALRSEPNVQGKDGHHLPRVMTMLMCTC